MDAAHHVPLRWVTAATTSTADVLLTSAFGRQVTRFVEMAEHSGQRKSIPNSVTTATLQRAMAARPDAQWSADTPALGARQLLNTSAAQPAETPSSPASRHATTATPTVMMDAVRTVLLSPDGSALIVRRVLRQSAQRYAETVRLSGKRQALRISVTMVTRPRAMAAVRYAQSSADTPALVARQLLNTSAGQPAETPSSLASRDATTETPTVGTDAVQTATRLRLDGRALPWRVVGPVARKSAETESKPLQKHATMAIRLPAMAAAPCAQSSADTRALRNSRHCVSVHHVVTESLPAGDQSWNHATMETQWLETVAARHAPLRWATSVTTTTVAHVLLHSAFGRQVTSFVGMGKHSGPNNKLTTSVTMVTRLRVTAAAPFAQSSAGTPVQVVPLLLYSVVFQPAETPSSLASRHATTATPTAGMDAGQTAIQLRLDGRALP